MSLTIRVVEHITDITRAEWNALLRPGEPPVLRWEWLEALESSGSAVAERGWEPRHFTAWKDGKLVGAAPAWRKHHSMGEYVYDFGWAQAAQRMGVDYYPKLLVGVPLSPLTARRFLVAAGEDEAKVRTALLTAMVDFAEDGGCSSVHVIFPPESEALALEGNGFFRRATMQYHWKNPGYRTYDDYLSRFDSKRRNQLKRERAEAANQGVTLRTVRSKDIGPEHAALAWRFYEATAGRYSWGPVQLTRKFFSRAFETMPDAVEIVVAERGGQAIAGAFNLQTPTRLYGRYWGCFEEVPFLHFHVCLYHSIDDCIQAGRQVFEPGAGGEHKVSRGFEPTTIHSVHRVFHKRLAGAVQDFCHREAEEVARITAESQVVAGLKPWQG